MTNALSEPLKDVLGNLIKVGSIVIYPGRSGSSIWNSFSIVREIVIGADYRGRPWRRLKVTNVTTKRISWRSEEQEAVVRNTTVYCLDRVVVLSPVNLKADSPIAEKLLELLK